MRTKIRNDGQALAAASFVRFYLGASTVRSRTDVRLAETTSFGSLAAGATSLLTSTNVRIPGSVAPGTYRIIACADGGGAVGEKDETNNCKASATINVTMPPLDPRR